MREKPLCWLFRTSLALGLPEVALAAKTHTAHSSDPDQTDDSRAEGGIFALEHAGLPPGWCMPLWSPQGI